MNNINNEDWDIIEESCRCQYLGIGKGHCKNSYTYKCDDCRNNQLITGKTDSHCDIDL